MAAGGGGSNSRLGSEGCEGGGGSNGTVSGIDAWIFGG